MQMSACVTSGGKSSAIFSFWPSWEEGTESRAGVGARRGGGPAARGEGGRGPRRGGRRREAAADAAALRAPSGRYAPGPAPRRRPRPGPRSPDGGSAPFRPHPRPPHESRGVLRAAGSRPERCRSSLRVTWDRGGRRGAGRGRAGKGGVRAARPGRETKGWDWGPVGGGGGRRRERGTARGCWGGRAAPAERTPRSPGSSAVPGPALSDRESGP